MTVLFAALAVVIVSGSVGAGIAVSVIDRNQESVSRKEENKTAETGSKNIDNYVNFIGSVAENKTATKSTLEVENGAIKVPNSRI